jgi:hypothetical protein
MHGGRPFDSEWRMGGPKKDTEAFRKALWLFFSRPPGSKERLRIALGIKK